jgi:sulfonate transport system substrate-binding protein
VVSLLLDEVDRTEQYASRHLDETAEFLEKDTRVPARVWRYALAREPWGVHYPLGQDVIGAQQGVADIFWRHHLIPKPVQVKDAVVNVSRD